MATLFSGNGTSYPGAIDTASLEVNSPAAGKTKARAAVPNDLAAAILAVQNELGTDPACSLATVKAFLQTEHNTDGTHKNSLVMMLAGSQTITGAKVFSSPPTLIGATVSGNMTISGTMNSESLRINSGIGINMAAPDVGSLAISGSMTNGTVPLARVGVNGTLTFSSISTASAGTEQSVTHGLGTDDVMVIFWGRGSVSSGAFNARVIRPDLATFSIVGTVGNTGIPTVSAPSSGNVNFNVYNTSGSTQTITIEYTILRRS